jgi:hypothetical protein
MAISLSKLRFADRGRQAHPMRAASSLILFLSGLVIGASATYFVMKPRPVAAPRVERVKEPPPPPVKAPTRLAIDDHDNWKNAGFVEMVPPVRLPTNGFERDLIEVWLKIPEGGVIKTRRLPDGTPSIRFPSGTISDRVERLGYEEASDGDKVPWPGNWKWTVTDVRGTKLTDDGELFHVYVPARAGALSPLMGWEWDRGDVEQEKIATAQLLRQLRAAPPLTAAGGLPSEQEHRRTLESYRQNNQCARCHVWNKPEQVASEEGIHRRTDDNGWFVPYATLFDRMPLEYHRPRELNVGDPFMKIECPSGDKATLEDRGNGARRWRCGKGGSPTGTFDVKAAMAKKDPRAIRLCDSRRYLHRHMDDEGKKAFAAAFEVCGIQG